MRYHIDIELVRLLDDNQLHGSCDCENGLISQSLDGSKIKCPRCKGTQWALTQAGHYIMKFLAIHTGQPNLHYTAKGELIR